MTLLEAEAAARLNGAHAPPSPPVEYVSPVPPAEPAVLPYLPRGLTNHAGTARRLLTRTELAAVKGEARRLYEGTSLSIGEISRRVDALPGTVSRWGKAGHWTRPEGAPVKAETFRPRTLSHETADGRRARMVQRLYRVFDRQTCDLEARAAAALGRTDEKDARTLSVLAKALETLIALDRDAGASSDTPEPAHREQSQAEFVERIRRWAEGEEGLAEG